MSKELNLKQITKSAKNFNHVAAKYAGFVLFISVLFIYAFLIFRINVLSSTEPTDEQINEKTGTTKRLKIDQNSIDKIQQLEDQNVGVKSIFEEARDNPFQD